MCAPVNVACRNTGSPTNPSWPTVAISTGASPLSAMTTSENTPESGNTTERTRSPCS